MQVNKGTAVFSECGLYRYRLERYFDGGDGTLTFCMLNPSTADAEKNDPTVRRCVGYAMRWGFARLIVVNIFAWRDTDPKKMKEAEDHLGYAGIVGDDNDEAISRAFREATFRVCAWGACAFPFVAKRQEEMISKYGATYPLFCLGRTAFGAPKHPLYIKGDVVPVSWPVPGVYFPPEYCK